MRSPDPHSPSWFNRPPPLDAPVFRLVLFRLRWALLAMLALATAATVGYVALEGYGWLDAIYMTVITLGTVGYGETRPLHTAGRLMTIGVIIVGFTTFVYAVSVLTNLFVSGDVLVHLHHRRSKRMSEALEHHVIVVGFGRVGRGVVRGLQEMGTRCVVLDLNEELEPEVRSAGGVQIMGDATNEDDLHKAGIDRADALIAACDKDADNLVVVLTARATRGDLRIVSRVNEAAWEERIKKAGANVAHSPYASYGMSLAAAAMSDAVLDFHDLPLLGLGTEEILVSTGSPLIGSTAAEIALIHPCTYVIGLRRDDRLHPWHGIDGAVREGDILVALGLPDYLSELGSAASPVMNGRSTELEEFVVERGA
jgi:voltage-gated potassium channel